MGNLQHPHDMWNLGKPQVFPVASSPPRAPERKMRGSERSRLWIGKLELLTTRPDITKPGTNQPA